MIEREKCDFVTNIEDSSWIRENLIHMITSVGTELDHEMKEMVKLGFVACTKEHNDTAIYQATEKGCDHIGMTKVGKKRALKSLGNK